MTASGIHWEHLPSRKGLGRLAYFFFFLCFYMQGAEVDVHEEFRNQNILIIVNILEENLHPSPQPQSVVEV